MRPRRTVIDPNNLQSIVEKLREHDEILDGMVEIGSAQDPRDPTSSYSANGILSNGTILNVRGSWVVSVVTAFDTKVDFVHNLGVQVVQTIGVNQPNVSWPIVMYRHDGNTADAASTLSCNYEFTDNASITSNSMPLRFYGAGTRVVGASHSLVVSVFFTPGVR